LVSASSPPIREETSVAERNDSADFDEGKTNDNGAVSTPIVESTISRVEGMDIWGAQLRRRREKDQEQEQEQAQPNKRQRVNFNSISSTSSEPLHAQPSAQIPNKCSVHRCGKTLESQNALWLHAAVYHPHINPNDRPRRFECPVQGCEKIHETQAALWLHAAAYHPHINPDDRPRRYKCPVHGCESALKDEIALSIHTLWLHKLTLEAAVSPGPQNFFERQ
jgi:hypothetical protein